MQFSSVLLSLFRFFLPPSLIGVLYLYFYPFITGCGFPPAQQAQAACLIPGSERPAVPAELAPFRLLTLADPQLEGDTSLPDPNAPNFPSLRHLHDVNSLRIVSRELISQDIPRLLQTYRKKLDLLGNDYYLAHIYRSVKWWTRPTHNVVLGDLLGSQWIGDEEFDIRADRFWNRVYNGAEPVSIDITSVSSHELLGQDEKWQNRIIAVAGNHDIGYAGDIDARRIERFERRFGRVNWDVEFRMGEDVLFAASPALRLVILNSMNLDGPAWDDQLRRESIDFMDQALSQKQETTTIVLTHIPLHKEAGVCVDAPLVNHFPAENGGGIREQNHLLPETTQNMLNLLQSSALILNGHDHEGCDTYHSLNDSLWTATRTADARRSGLEDGIREITVRSQMGSFGGNAGLLSAWYDHDEEEWKFAYATCVAGVQHIWWAVHVLALVEVGFGVFGVIFLLVEEWQNRSAMKEKKKME